MQTNIQDLFTRHQGIAGAQTLREHGVNYHQLNRLVEQGTVQKLKRGLYKWTETENYEMADVARMVKNGVFCLYSAAFFHELTTFIPQEHSLAIPDKSKVALPDYPRIKLYYWDRRPWSIGIHEILLDNATIKVYSPEKTVCDVVRFRKRTGMDFAKEVLNTYLARPGRNIGELMRLSRLLNIEGVMRTYLEILV